MTQTQTEFCIFNSLWITISLYKPLIFQCFCSINYIILHGIKENIQEMLVTVTEIFSIYWMELDGIETYPLSLFPSAGSHR